MATIHCNIVSAEAEIYSGDAEMVIAHGSAGDLGISHGHAALLTGLEPGPVRVMKEDGSEEVVYVSGGYLEVQPSGVSILADTALRAADLDEASAIQAQKDAEAAMANQSSEINYSQAAARLAAATAQLRTLQAIRKTMGK